MNEEQVESRSLLDLAKIIQEARKLGVGLVLIGGYAVAAYTHGYRYTKDVDLVADKPAIGRFEGLCSFSEKLGIFDGAEIFKAVFYKALRFFHRFGAPQQIHHIILNGTVLPLPS